MRSLDIDQPDGAVKPRRRRRRIVHGDHPVQGRRLPQQPHATLVSRRTVLLRGRPRWLAVGRRRRRGRRLRVHLMGQETVRLHVSRRRVVMVMLMVMGVEDGLRRGGRARGADADTDTNTDAHSDADRVRQGGGTYRGHRGSRLSRRRHRHASGSASAG